MGKIYGGARKGKTKRNHEENETHFHLKTIIMTMRRTAVHPRRGGLKLYFSLHYATSR